MIKAAFIGPNLRAEHRPIKTAKIALAFPRSVIRQGLGVLLSDNAAYYIINWVCCARGGR